MIFVIFAKLILFIKSNASLYLNVYFWQQGISEGSYQQIYFLIHFNLNKSVGLLSWHTSRWLRKRSSLLICIKTLSIFGHARDYKLPICLNFTTYFSENDWQLDSLILFWSWNIMKKDFEPGLKHTYKSNVFSNIPPSPFLMECLMRFGAERRLVRNLFILRLRHQMWSRSW